MRSQSFPSSSNPDVTYTASITDEGLLRCNCRGWTVKKLGKPRQCTHTKQLAGTSATTARGEFLYLTDPTAAPHAPALAPTARATSSAPAPMLASAMTTPAIGEAFDRRFGADAGWLMEEKLDGHRCVVTIADGIITARSRPRAGAAAANVRDLPRAIVVQLLRFPDGVYDGELVAPSGKAWDVTTVGAALVFVIFDILQSQGTDITAQPYTSRRRWLLDILAASLTPAQTAVSTVESVVPTWAGVQAIWARGGEGVILKRATSTYRPGARSAEWVKVKAIGAATLTITGFGAGKSGPCSVFLLRDSAGVDTTVKVLGNAMLADVTAHPDRFIGRRVVISFQEKTPSGSYRHGIFDHFAAKGE